MPLLYENLIFLNGLPIINIPKNYALGQIIFETTVTHVYDKYILLKEGMTVLDVGASIGVFSVYASQKINPSGKIFAFEPEPESYNALVANSKVMGNITPINKGLYSTSCMMKLNCKQICSSIYSDNVKYNQNDTANSNFTTLDDFASEFRLNHIDFVKIDAEGAANEILKGAKNTLPIIDSFAIAAYHKHENPKEMEQLLQSYGFYTKIKRDFGITPYLYATRKILF